MGSRSSTDRYVAVDLGAESGRVIVGELSGIEIVHRFANRPVRVGDSLYWDILAIFAEVKEGLREAFRRYPRQIVGIALDTWGLDYGLLDAQGDLLGNLYHYRDRRTDGMPEQLWTVVPRQEVFRQTGIQFMQINTLYQLYAHCKQKPEVVGQARSLLLLPSLLNYWLTGVAVDEYSHVTTTQLYNPQERDWAWELIDALGFDRRWFGRIVMPGTVLGPLLPHVAEEVGAGPEVRVIAPATHDTGSAAAATPALGEGEHAFLSSGTWSLLGVEIPEPILSDKAYRYNFTNEGAATGGIRLLKNITGLWIVQECKRSWDREGPERSYGELVELAEKAGPASFTIDVNDPRFLKPGLIDDSMPDRIRAYCAETGQRCPAEPGALVRGVLESLAQLYARTIGELEEITARRIRELYIIGGGSRNELLCRLTAQAAGIPTFAGPVEATALGNILVQALSLGRLDSLAAGRAELRRSFPIQEYLPEGRA
ncbi:MAG: rhamnulokinase [Spirochaetales bacterium]|nr:rhamnulokinase [Spirochaetales bacterium]